MFQIRFDDSRSDASCEAGDYCGRITIGDFTEGFCASGTFWSQKDYIDQWLACIEQLVERDGASSAAITSMTDLASANFVVTWPMFRHGDRVHIYNQLLLLDDARPTNVAELLGLVQPEEQPAEDGPVSQWITPLADLAAFARSART